MADIPVAQPLFVMRNIDEIYDWQNMLFYGDFGSGKTYLAATSILVPDMCDILYVALEGGEKTLKEIVRLCKRNNIDPKRIQVIPVQTYKQFAYVYEFLKIHVKARDNNDVETLRKLESQITRVPIDTIVEPKRFKTVIIDSLTEGQKYCMYQILGIDPLTQKLDSEPDTAQFQDWGKSREMVQFLVRRFRDLPIHTLFICGQDIEQDARKQFHYDPMLPGKLANDVRGLVDTVGYLMTIPQEGGSITRRLILQGGVYGGAHYAAKHRYGTKLKSLWIDNPDMKILYDLGLE